MKAAMLPRAYWDAVEIMADAGRAMRAGQIAVAMGLPDEAAKREELGSKLKRLVERGCDRLDCLAENLDRTVAVRRPGRRPVSRTTAELYGFAS
jgi:hypothetical protein